MSAICPVDGCGKELFWSDPEMSTLVGYMPTRDGHIHDNNCLKRGYTCEAGHQMVLSIRRSCKDCDWRGKVQCFCHKGDKVDAWPDARIKWARQWIQFLPPGSKDDTF
jgi:hypothetical protein